MNPLENFGEAQNVAVTVLVDNRADLIVKSTDTIKYFTDEALLAEHGFSALIALEDARTKASRIRILWDAGITEIALLENARRMKIDLTTVDKIALSHGHDDHTAAMTEVLKAIAIQPNPKEWPKDATMEDMVSYARHQHRVPLVAHPAAFRELWGIAEDGRKYGPMFGPPRDVWAAYGADIVLSEGPHQLGPGCWTTGQVPRHSFETSGIPTRSFYREGNEFRPHRLEDDQVVVIHVKDKGLVVVSGCAHSGIVNTVHYAREISGVDKVWAVLGGFHLARASDEDIQRTIDAVKALSPTLVGPTHCTGFRAIRAFAEQMPEAFVPCVVGMTYLF